MDEREVRELLARLLECARELGEDSPQTRREAARILGFDEATKARVALAYYFGDD